jgi:hypothetical protein
MQKIVIATKHCKNLWTMIQKENNALVQAQQLAVISWA